MSVETPEITNIKRKEMMISSTRDWRLDPTGTVPKKECFVTGKTAHNVALARTEPNNCATI